MIKLLVLCLVITTCYGGKVPFITPCKRSDEACLARSAQAALPHIADGLPDLGVPPADPLVLDDVRGDDGPLKLQFKNLHVTGTKHCKFLSVKIADDQSTLSFVMECPITATGQYEVDGKLLVVDIEGNGDFEIKTDKMKIIVEAHTDKVDGHWHIKDVIYSYEPQEQVHFRLQNLFGGNEEKSNPVHEILNHSWKEVTLTIGKPIVKQLVFKAKDIINDFLAAVPAEELFAD